MTTKTTHTPGYAVIEGSACPLAGSGGLAEGWTVTEDRDGGEVVATHIPTRETALLIAAAIARAEGR